MYVCWGGVMYLWISAYVLVEEVKSCVCVCVCVCVCAHMCLCVFTWLSGWGGRMSVSFALDR